MTERRVFSNATPENVQAMREVLARLMGLENPPTGDVLVTINDVSYAFAEQTGMNTAAVVSKG